MTLLFLETVPTFWYNDRRHLEVKGIKKLVKDKMVRGKRQQGQRVKILHHGGKNERIALCC